MCVCVYVCIDPALYVCMYIYIYSVLMRMYAKKGTSYADSSFERRPYLE